MGLYNVRNKKLKTYSGGMLQRIGIAQALLNNPKLLVLDEPTSGLDPKERSNFRNIIDSLSKDRIILLSTHIVSDIEYIADKIMILKEGTLLLNNSTDCICNTLNGYVWEAVTSQEEANRISRKNIISNMHHIDSEVELRIISECKPLKNAISVTPNLEDLYLYYFCEEAANEFDKI
jgi:ABC-2 type transport system ATP-binding protein